MGRGVISSSGAARAEAASTSIPTRGASSIPHLLHRRGLARWSPGDNRWSLADKFGYGVSMSLGGALRVLVSELASVGLDPAAIYADAQVVDEDAPLGLDELSRVLERAEEAAGDPLLGLHMAEHARGRGVLSYLARAQRTVREGLHAFERSAGQAWGNSGAVHVDERGADTFVRFDVGPGVPRHALEYLVARTAISLARSGARPRETVFRHGPAGPPDEYRRVLGCPVRFGQPVTGISLRSDDLRRRLRDANPEAAAALSAALDRPPVRDAPPASARLAAAVDDALVRGARIDREVLARSLGMSGKTLARRLAAEGRRFTDVVDDVRRTLARRLVDDRSLALGEVATRAGFADVAAFGKAFRRWFGRSPSAVRSNRT